MTTFEQTDILVIIPKCQGLEDLCELSGASKSLTTKGLCQYFFKSDPRLDLPLPLENRDMIAHIIKDYDGSRDQVPYCPETIITFLLQVATPKPTIAPLPSMQVLYNDAYGDGFQLSSDFLEEYKVRTGKEIKPSRVLFHKTFRTDPVALAIYNEKGTEWCSAPQSYITVREFSSIFANYWEIEEQDGNETVRLLVSEALADVLHTYVATGDKPTMERQYKAIVAAAEEASTYLTIESKSPDVEVISHAGYSYFGSPVDPGHA